MPLAEFLSNAPTAAERLFADPSGAPLALEPTPTVIPAASEAATRRHGMNMAIGPEGGFADAELATAHTAGWHIVSLGARILRVETAAILLAGLAAQQFGRVKAERDDS